MDAGPSGYYGPRAQDEGKEVHIPEQGLQPTPPAQGLEVHRAPRRALFDRFYNRGGVAGGPPITKEESIREPRRGRGMPFYLLIGVVIIGIIGVPLAIGLPVGLLKNKQCVSFDFLSLYSEVFLLMEVATMLPLHLQVALHQARPRPQHPQQLQPHLTPAYPPNAPPQIPLSTPPPQAPNFANSATRTGPRAPSLSPQAITTPSKTSVTAAAAAALV